jgi:hypothetical protein
MAKDVVDYLRYERNYLVPTVVKTAGLQTTRAVSMDHIQITIVMMGTVITILT